MKKLKTPRSASEPRSAQAFMARLRLDHAQLSRVLREIEVQRTRLRTEPAAARAVLDEALTYLVEYMHGHHHPREDLLYRRLAPLRADLADELRELGRDHQGSSARIRQLATAVRRLPASDAHGRAGERLAGAVQDYVDETREHMRREERAVIYAGVEPWLSNDDWQALSAQTIPADPLADAARLRRHYPHLAAALAEPVRDVSSRMRAGLTADQPYARSLEALRDGADELVEAYGELLHEGLEVVRANAAALWSAPSPLGAVEVLPQVSRRSYQFAARCFTLPSRVALECASRMFAPFSAQREPPASKK